MLERTLEEKVVELIKEYNDFANNLKIKEIEKKKNELMTKIRDIDIGNTEEVVQKSEDAREIMLEYKEINDELVNFLKRISNLRNDIYGESSNGDLKTTIDSYYMQADNQQTKLLLEISIMNSTLNNFVLANNLNVKEKKIEELKVDFSKQIEEAEKLKKEFVKQNKKLEKQKQKFR